MKHGPLSSEWRNVPEYDRRVKTGIYLALTILVLCVAPAFSQLSPAPARGKIPDDNKADVQKSAPASAQLPQLVDITASTGIKFDHLSSPEQKYIVESMSGGVALIDYDRDGWPDIYFTNAQSVEMALAGKKARSALYHNNHDGTFTDVTDKAGRRLSVLPWARAAGPGMLCSER